MRLCGLFQQVVGPTLAPGLSDERSLEEALLGLYQAGAESYPEIQLSQETFIPFLARHIPAETRALQDLKMLHGAQLYLVCAYGLGDPAAQQVIEHVHMAKVRRALCGLGLPDAQQADIKQDLRRRLVEMHDPSIRRIGYSGRSDLAGWLCLSGLREARMTFRRAAREAPLEQAMAELVPTRAHDPDLELLIQRYKTEFQSALAQATAALTVRERNLLRYYFVGQLSIDQIGRQYHIHRSTAARWVNQAQERLCMTTRERFLAMVPSQAASLPGIMALIMSRLSLSLRALLTESAEAEPRQRPRLSS